MNTLIKVTGRIGLCLFCLLSANVILAADHAGKDTEKKIVLLPPGRVMVTGVVFDDADGDGVQTANEKGLKDIPVSNGDTIVLTKADGSYSILSREGMSIFPIVPADRALSGSRLVNASFHYLPLREVNVKERNHGKRKYFKAQVSFGLKPRQERDNFTLNAIGDIQVGNYQEIDYLSRTLWPELLQGCKDEVNLFLGDLVNNKLALYPDLRAMMEALPQTSYTVPGNHDRDVDSVISRQNRTYNNTFGADAYAFNEGKVHFIVLNNVYGKGARGYEGRVNERQLRFVKNDLQQVSPDKLVVLTMHIPLKITKNAGDLIALLANHPHRMAISGHLHYVGRFFPTYHNITVPELGAGAACGFWWVGEKDWDGVPAALQQGGTPRNYFKVNFTGNTYSLRCKTIGGDPMRQMSIHVTGIDTLDNHLRDYKDVPKGLLLVTVYGGCDSTTVRCRIDGGAWQTCQRAKLIEPNVTRTREMNLSEIYPTRYNRRNPLRNRTSKQLWQYTLPAEAQQGVHRVDIEAEDAYGLHATGTRMYCMP